MLELRGTRGVWPGTAYPQEIHVNGDLYRRAVWEAPYDGVVAQYREDREKSSGHVRAYEDGTWELHDVDNWNPDRGRVLEHAVADVIPSLVTPARLLIAAAVVSLLALAFVSKRTLRSLI